MTQKQSKLMIYINRKLMSRRQFQNTWCAAVTVKCEQGFATYLSLLNSQRDIINERKQNKLLSVCMWGGTTCKSYRWKFMHSWVTSVERSTPAATWYTLAKYQYLQTVQLPHSEIQESQIVDVVWGDFMQTTEIPWREQGLFCLRFHCRFKISMQIMYNTWPTESVVLWIWSKFWTKCSQIVQVLWHFQWEHLYKAPEGKLQMNITTSVRS
jgi:hypothetical protein